MLSRACDYDRSEIEVLTSNSLTKTCSGFWAVKRVPLLLLHDRLHFGWESQEPRTQRVSHSPSVDWSRPGTSGPHHSSHQFHLSNHLCLSAFTFLLNFQNSLLCKKHDRLGSGARKQYTRSLGSLLATHKSCFRGLHGHVQSYAYR